MDATELNVLTNLLYSYIRLSSVSYGPGNKQRCDLIEFQRWAEVETGQAYALEEVNCAGSN